MRRACLLPARSAFSLVYFMGPKALFLSSKHLSTSLHCPAEPPNPSLGDGTEPATTWQRCRRRLTFDLIYPWMDRAGVMVCRTLRSVFPPGGWWDGAQIEPSWCILTHWQEPVHTGGATDFQELWDNWYYASLAQRIVGLWTRSSMLACGHSYSV